MLQYRFPGLAAASGILALAFSPLVQADSFSATLSGYDEVPPISTPASGDFELLAINGSLEYTLRYDDLTDEITAAHIHFGQPGVNGGIMAFLCNNHTLDPDPPVTTQDCTGTEGEVTGILTAADVVGPEDQGIAPEEFDAVLAAIEAGVAYANVHSLVFPGGEIRGAISLVDDDGDDNGNDAGEDDLEDRLSDLEGAIDALAEAVVNHTHTYLTGRGQGHNNTEATTSPPTFED